MTGHRMTYYNVNLSLSFRSFNLEVNMFVHVCRLVLQIISAAHSNMFDLFLIGGCRCSVFNRCTLKLSYLIFS